MLAVMAGTKLVGALTPAAQVLVVAWLVRSSADGVRAVAEPLVVLAVLLFVSGTAGGISQTTQARLDFRLERRYLGGLMDAVTRCSPQELARAETSATIEACRQSTYELAYLVSLVTVAAGAAVTAVSLCASVWTLSPWAGGLVALALVPGVVSAARVARQQDAIFVPYGRARRRASYLVEQLVSARTATELATLGTSHQVAALADRHQAEATSLRDAIVRAAGRGETLATLVTTGLLGAALVAIVADSGGAGAAAGILGVIAGTAATRIGGFAFGSLVMGSPKVRRYRAFVGRPGDLAPQHVTHSVDRIELRDVRVTYPGAGRPALDGVSLTADAGMVVALVGVNGAGKTTAVNALLGTVDLDSGSVSIDGADAAALPLDERLGRFGLLTQEYGRYELTVRDTVRLGTPEAVTDDQVWAALDAARIGDVVRTMPHGLDTQLGTQFDGVGLSGGQWQRLALARVHLRDAGVWVLDEPTSAIDAEAEQQIFAELRAHRAARITIVVSHRAWTLREMDHIYVFDHGRIVEDGRYDDLLAAGGRFAEIFAEQA